MLGAYIAISLVIVVWGVLLTKIIRATNFRELWETLHYSTNEIERREKTMYRKKGWTDRVE